MDHKLMPTLKYENISLMPWTVEYAADMLLFAANEKVMKPADVKVIPDMKAAKTKIRGLDKKNSTEWALAIEENGEDHIIGNIGITPVISIKEYEKVVEIGYLLAEEYWGRGIMSKAVSILLRHCFQDLACDAVTIRMNPENAGSVRIAEKNGMKFYRKRTTNGRLHHTYLVSKDDYC